MEAYVKGERIQFGSTQAAEAFGRVVGVKAQEQADFNETNKSASSFIKNIPFIFADMRSYETATEFIEENDLLNKMGQGLFCLFRPLDSETAIPAFFGINLDSIDTYRIDFAVPVVSNDNVYSLYPEPLYSPGWASMKEMTVYSYVYDPTNKVLTPLGKNNSLLSEPIFVTSDSNEDDIKRMIDSIPTKGITPIRMLESTTNLSDADNGFCIGDTIFIWRKERNQFKSYRIDRVAGTFSSGIYDPTILCAYYISENILRFTEGVAGSVPERILEAAKEYRQGNPVVVYLDTDTNGSPINPTIVSSMDITYRTDADTGKPIYDAPAEIVFNIFGKTRGEFSLITWTVNTTTWASSIERTPIDIHTPDWLAQTDNDGYIKNKTHCIKRTSNIYEFEFTNYNAAGEVLISDVSLGLVYVFENLSYPLKSSQEIVFSKDSKSIYLSVLNGPHVYVSVVENAETGYYDLILDNSSYTPNKIRWWCGNVEKTLNEIFIPDTIARKTDIPEQVQADWNENNSDSKAFVKGRTHSARYLGLLSNHDELENFEFTDNSVFIPLEYLDTDCLKLIGYFDEHIYIEFPKGEGADTLIRTVDFDGGADTVTFVFDGNNVGLTISIEYGTYPIEEFLAHIQRYNNINKLSEVFIPETIARTSEVTEQINNKITELINAAPETLDTLGELAAAIQENASVIDTLNSAITNKADKSSVTTLQTSVNTLNSTVATHTTELANKVGKEELTAKNYATESYVAEAIANAITVTLNTEV